MSLTKEPPLTLKSRLEMKSRILVIEDDRILLENTAELLELSGYEVEKAENGKIGVKKVHDFEPDLIVCDVMMPELDGYGVLYILAKNPKTSSIPFIFLTAKTEKEDFRKGMSLGADDYLTKPFDELELLNAVEARLKKIQSLKKEFSQDSAGIQEFIKEAELLNVVGALTEDRKLYTYNSGEFIFREGDFANFIYFVEKGSVKTYKHNDNHKELILEIYSKGDFFGYQAVLEDREYAAFSAALEQSEIYKIPKQDFLKLLYGDVSVSSRFIKMISRNLSDKEDQLVQLAYDSVKKRVAIQLLQLTKEDPENTIDLSRGDFANLIATSKETLVRILSSLKEDGIIDSDGMTIKILQREKLIELQKWS